jgi:ectoine hydroxylase-related dioxygenase (phytanoyl-CoA dioxygenase family)
MTSIATIEKALAALGVTPRTLGDAEKAALDAHGYVILDRVLTAEELAELRREFDAAAAAQSDPGTAGRAETGTRHLDDLGARAECFRRVSFAPRVLAAVFHVLNCRFFVSKVSGREPLGGYGRQGLHADWSFYERGRAHIATAIAMLDDVSPENGATRVVPGSHQAPMPTDRHLRDPAFVHPREVIITAPAGSVLLFNGHLLHSATRNETGARRRTLQIAYPAYEHLARMESVRSGDLGSDPAERFLAGA